MNRALCHGQLVLFEDGTRGRCWANLDKAMRDIRRFRQHQRLIQATKNPLAILMPAGLGLSKGEERGDYLSGV
jgi:hypothetical protein